MTQTTETKFDLVSAIIEFESGQLDEDGVIQLFQNLVDTGLAWTLQGTYGRTALALISAGLVNAPEEARV